MRTIKSKLNLSEEKGKLKQRFAALTGDDLLFEEGKKEEMRGKHKAMLKRTKKELKQMLSTKVEYNELWSANYMY